MQIKGKSVDVSDAVNASVMQIINDINSLYTNFFGAGAFIDHIAITGGGGGLLMNDLMVEVFDDHGSVQLADQRQIINFANAMGGAEMTLSRLSAEGNLTVG